MIDDSCQGDGANGDSPLMPEYEVWNHLYSGLQSADFDLQETVGDDVAEFYKCFGEFVYNALTRLVVDHSDPKLAETLVEKFPAIMNFDRTTLLQQLLHIYRTESSPVLKHSIDLKFGWEAIGRGHRAFERLRRMADALADAPLPAGG